MKWQKIVQRNVWLTLSTCDGSLMWETALDNERTNNALKGYR
jgi:hypothetical protein